ncbi:MAG: hypothetical protein QF475_03705 [Candidatus Undinarchaeales archaeon]|jgi:hypothetical protein|nr:hypothetical protein [Candidatus Undinarchaeales archaeon]
MADSVNSFKKNLTALAKSISDYKTQGGSSNGGNEILDYKAGKSKYLQLAITRALSGVQKSVWGLTEVRSADPSNEILLLDILNKVNTLSQNTPIPSLAKSCSELSTLSSKLILPTSVGSASSSISFQVPELPDEITDDVMADMNEIRKGFDAGCYRSSVIICGRILEAALNRKYFEVSGNDLLETSPGLGLGKLIGKLSEKGVKFDPGLTQQIHMINQVRIYSVHKKKDAFYPSKGQTQAMVLYTMDVLKKLFSG